MRVLKHSNMLLVCALFVQSCTSFSPLHVSVLPRLREADVLQQLQHAAPFTMRSPRNEGRWCHFQMVERKESRTSTKATTTPSLIEELNRGMWESRLAALELQAIDDFKKAIGEFSSDGAAKPVLTTALLAGDQVILHILHKAGLLKEIQVMFIDTFHLFDETYDFLEKVEQHYGFKAATFKANDCETRADFDDKYGDDLFIEDVETYDRIAKVEPLMRGLREYGTRLWINGRRRDQGFERAHVMVWEHDKMNPLAFWTFEDCWKYIARENIPYHPLHDDGYPSIGDLHSTLRIDKSQWYYYGMERAGRFTDIQKPDVSQ